MLYLILQNQQVQFFFLAPQMYSTLQQKVLAL